MSLPIPRQRVGAVLALALLLVLTAAGQRATVPRIPYERFTLPNGMQVVLSADHSVPIVTEAMIFDVGGRVEHRGRSGFAHLFEHLMFEGSAHAPKGVFDHLVEGYGGTDNASTHTDYTYYFETVPSNVLPVLMWLDADRLANLNVTAANMKNQIAVVEEEKRMRVDNQPYGPLLYVDLDNAAFVNWQNAHPVIGSFADLDAATLGDVQKFFQAYYAPRNGVLVIVGDIDIAKTAALVRQYFGWIPNRGTITPVNTAEPAQRQEKDVTVHDANANLPALAIAWKGPERNSPDFYALAVLGEMLFDGKSSRLYQSLVKQNPLAVSVDGGLGFPDADYTDYRAPGLFSGFIMLKSQSDPKEVEGLIFREIHDIEANGVGAAELERVRTRIAANWLRNEESTGDRAQLLAIATLFDNDPEGANRELVKLLAVTPEQIVHAAQTWLSHPQVTTVVDEPGAAPKPAPTPKPVPTKTAGGGK